MAFPTIPTVGAGRVLTAVQANATSPRTFPSLTSLTKNAGDLLIGLIAAYETSGATPPFTWGGSFTSFSNTTAGAGITLIGAAYKYSDGTETGTFTVTQAGTITGHAAMILLSIPGSHQTTTPRAGTLVQNAAAGADPASFDPSLWVNEETLWISVAASAETSLTGSFTGLSTAPTNYGNSALSSISADAIGGMQIGVAFRQLQATTEDVGAWTQDTSNARNSALVIAVRPAPLVVTMSMFDEMCKQFPDRRQLERRAW